MSMQVGQLLMKRNIETVLLFCTKSYSILGIVGDGACNFLRKKWTGMLFKVRIERAISGSKMMGRLENEGM